MAIYHLSASVVSRNKGMSAVAKSSYNSCDKIKNEYDGTLHNYSNKPDHTYHEILLPKNAPEEYRDKAKLWNAVELSEKSKNAQLCRSFDIALPKELNQQEQEKLIHDFCKENFSDKGMCVQIDIHSVKGNPHAHVMTTMREIDENGKWKAKSCKEYLCTNGEDKKYFRPNEIPEGWEKVLGKKGEPKSRKADINNWNEKETLLEWRKNWSEKCNEKLKEKGEKEITHLSHKDRELYKQPQIHLGSYNHKLMKQGQTNERIEKYQNIIEQNKQIREIRQAFNNFFEKLKRDMSRPNHNRVDLLLKSKQQEEWSKLSVGELRFEVENNLMTINRKQKELDSLYGWSGIFKTKEKAELKEQIDELKKRNYKLDELIEEKKKARETTEIKEKPVANNSALERINRQFEKIQVQEQTPERLQLQEQRRKQVEEQNKMYHGLFDDNRYGIKPRAGTEPKTRDTSKPIVKQLPKGYSQNQEHDLGNPMEKSKKAKAKDRETEVRKR